MNFLFISPYFPYNFQAFASRLKDSGVTVLGMGTESYEQLSHYLQTSLSDYYQVDSLENYDQVIRGVSYLQYKYGKIDRVESHDEYWLPLDAQIRLDFNIFGMKPTDLPAIRYKSEMKKKFREAGLPVADGLVAETADEIRAAAKQLSYPLICKPDSGVGTAGTYKVENDQALDRFIQDKAHGLVYFIEQMISGDLVTYDGLINSDGDVVFDVSFEYNKPTLDIVCDDSEISYIVQREINPKLQEYGRLAVKAFGFKERFFHIEFFRLADGSYQALEYNCRPAGGLTLDVYNYANDIDIYQAYADVVLGKRDPVLSGHPYFAAFASRRDSHHYAYSLEALRHQLGSALVYESEVPAIFAGLLGDYSLIVRHQNKEEVLKMIDKIQQRAK